MGVWPRWERGNTEGGVIVDPVGLGLFEQKDEPESAVGWEQNLEQIPGCPRGPRFYGRGGHCYAPVQ